MTLYIHSYFRWVAIACLLICIFRAINGIRSKAVFSNSDNAWRHWTATVLQIQMLIGLVLYFKSPVVNFFWAHDGHFAQDEPSFFGIIHISLMLLAVIILSVGSALSKRKEHDQAKYATMLLWFSVALIIILVSIPWPFSPFAQRPYLR